LIVPAALFASQRSSERQLAARRRERLAVGEQLVRLHVEHVRDVRQRLQRQVLTARLEPLHVLGSDAQRLRHCVLGQPPRDAQRFDAPGDERDDLRGSRPTHVATMR